MAPERKSKSGFPLLPLRGLLVFPGMVLHFDVGRERSVRALEEAMVREHLIVLTSQQDGQVDEPSSDELYEVGTLVQVKQMMKLPNGTIRVLVEGTERVTIQKYIQTEGFYEVRVKRHPADEDKDASNAEVQALVRAVLQQFELYVKVSRKVEQGTYDTVTDIADPGRFADAIASHLPLKVKDKQSILEAFDVVDRLERILKVLSDEREVMELEKKIHQRVRKQMEKTQKEYYLREQMKAIQRELGEREGRLAEVEELRELADSKNLPDTVKERVQKELDRLERIPVSSAEGTVVRTYIDWILALPWSEQADSDVNVNRAEDVLNREHFGMDKVKERILEFLSVQQLSAHPVGPVICLAGPPGVGKTSLAKSIASSLRRPFVRVSLGGVRDDAEIRGHRRTYVGAMPGRILQGMRQAGVQNPVFLLDEIDKMASDFRGDPAAAMLEVLDPEQNGSFSDHYIEMPYDLSNVMFITTANDLSMIPGPLRDRMELIQIPGYTELEKLEIAKRHLLPKQKEVHALSGDKLRMGDDVMLEMIRFYTREAGVRQLDRLLASVTRKVARQIASSQKKRVTVTHDLLTDFLGAPMYHHGMVEESDEVGVVTGLAWTAVGGDTLTIEVSIVPGSGKVVLTGSLGDVMKESAQTALSYVRSRSQDLGIQRDAFETQDIHVHVPEGATPKDGPSAGVTMATAIASALTERPVDRYVAMTGEVTLRGRVLPIGGLKEKSLAAHRAGIRTVLLPDGNKKDLADIPESVREQMQFIPVKHMDDVLGIALKAAADDHTKGLSTYPPQVHEDYAQDRPHQ